MMKVRWGLIGCGDIVRKRVAAALSSGRGCELVAFSRARADLADAFAREFGARKFHADWKELVTDDEIDAVYIATPVHLHAVQTSAAARAGKHVLCEKPMALDVAECDLMNAACVANGVKLGIAYYRHFYPAVERIKQILESGEIGNPVLVEINAFERFDPAPSDDRYWFVELEKAGGGPMMDFGCHRVEILLNLFGNIETVQAVTSNVVFSREVEDTSVALLGFKQGLQGVLAVSHAAFEPRDTLDVYGSHGSIHIPLLNQGTIRIKAGSDERSEECPPHANLHLPLIEDFAESILTGRDPRVSGTTGRAVAEVIDRIYRR